MIKIYKKTYKNGLRALAIPVLNNPTVSVMVMTATGSNHENKDNNGVSHFLEHLHFKGTKKRPSSKIISEEFDRMGSINNASTGNEMTTYYAKGDSKNFSKMLDVISDIYLNSTFPEKEIEKEKGVVIEEINMYEDLPQYQVSELLEKLLYGDQPAGRSIAGTKENIKKHIWERVNNPKVFKEIDEQLCNDYCKKTPPDNHTSNFDINFENEEIETVTFEDLVKKDIERKLKH